MALHRGRSIFECRLLGKSVGRLLMLKPASLTPGVRHPKHARKLNRKGANMQRYAKRAALFRSLKAQALAKLCALCAFAVSLSSCFFDRVMSFRLLASSVQYQSALHPMLVCPRIPQAVHAGYVAEDNNGIGAIRVLKNKNSSVLLFCLAMTFWVETPAFAEEPRTAGDERYNRPAGCLVAQVRLPMQMEIHRVTPTMPCIDGTENEEIIAKCSPGTVIELPVEATCSIEELCDFSKAIFNTTTKKTLCVMRQH